MPTSAEGLTPDTPLPQVKAAISASIAKLIDEGYEQEQAIAMAYSMARKATGRELGKGG